MAGNRDIHGSVVLDVTVDGEQTAKERLQAAFASVDAKVNVDAQFKRQQVQAALDVAASKGRGLRVDVQAVFSKAQMQRELTAKATGGRPLRVRVDAQFSRPQIQRAIREAVAGNAPKVRIETDVRRGTFTTVVADANKAQREITDFEQKQNVVRETQRLGSSRRTNDKVRAQESKGDQDRTTDRQRALNRLDVLEDQHVKRLVQFEAAAAQRREVINAQLQARVAAQNNLFEQRQEIARQRVQSRLNSKPLIQRVLLNTNAFNQSLAEFDRTVSRALRTSLLAFSVWSAGVAALTAAAAGAAIVSFARLESATARASAVFAGGQFADALEKGTANAKTFGNAVTAVSGQVEAASKKIALQTLFNPTEVAQGFQSAAQAGLSFKDSVDSLLPVTQFAQNELLDVNEALELLTGGLSSAGQQGGKSLRLLADQFTLVGNLSNATAKQVAESFSNQAAAAFRAYGQSAEQALAVINLFGKANLRGLEAGTQTAILIREINNAAFNKSPAAFKKYGIALEDANGQAVPFTKTLGQLGGLFERVRKEQGNSGVANLRKELGLTEKSLRGLIILLPQIEKLGTAGLERQVSLIEKAGGSVARQAKPIQNTIEFQFQQTLENVANLFSTFGKGARNELIDVFAALNGPDGIIANLDGQVRNLGDRFGELVGRFSSFVTSKDAANGASILVDAIRITLEGVRDAFTAFSSAFNEAQGTESTFVAIAQSIRAFASVSATVLPAVAKVLGQIFDFLIDNADAFEFFAKATLGLFAIRKAYSLLIQPLGQATLGILAVRNALVAATGAEAANTVVGSVARIADAYGLLGKQAQATAASIELVQVANSSAFPTLGRGGKAGVAAKGTAGSSGTGAALAGNAALLAPDLTRVFSGGAEGAKTARAATAFEKIAPAAAKGAGPLGRVTAIFIKMGEVFAKLVPGFIKAVPVLGRLATGFAKFAGPVGIVIALIDGAIGIFRGFFQEISKTKDESSEVGRTFAELKPIFEGVFEVVKTVGAVLLDVLGVVGRIGQSIGRSLGQIFNDALINFGDVIRGIKALFTGDFTTFLQAFGDVIINSITAPFRLAIGFVIDLVADLLGNLEHVPIVGDKVKGVADGLRDAASATRDLRVNMSAAEVATDNTKKSTDGLNASVANTATTAAEFTQQAQITARIAGLVGQAYARSAAQARGSVVLLKNQTDQTTTSTETLLTAIGGFQPKFAGAAAAGVGALGQIRTAAQSTTGQLLAMQAVLQAGLGQTANATQSLIESGLQQQLQNAKEGVGPLSVEQAQAAINAQNEQERRQRLIAAARRSARDQKIIDDALGTGPSGLPLPEPPAPTGAAARAAQRTFTDPDDAVQAAIDRLKPVQKIAQTNALISKVVGEAGKSYQLTRRDTILLAETMPRIDKAIEVQKKKVEELTTALDTLRNVQLKGTKAFSDAAFENDQAVKRLQLQRLDALAVPGTTEESAPIKAIDDQIKALQTTAERSSLVESLELDPLRRKLEETFNPVKEDTFANIIKRFNELSTAQQAQTDKLTGQEAIQAKLNDRLTAAQERYTKIDEAAQKSVEAFNSAQQAASGTATSFSSVGTSAAAGARSVTKYSTAVENVPTGKGVVDKSLKGINDRVAELAPQFQSAGTNVVTYFTQGINRGLLDILQPALARVVERTLIYLRTPAGPAENAGTAIMTGFLKGMTEKFGADTKTKGTIAYFLNVFIPEWIKANKGPVAYDATILVPAGHAVMEGFGTGLRAGFAQIQSFVKDVGPSLKEFISTDAFSGRTATIMADIAMGKTPDVDGVFEDIRAAMTVTAGSFPGDADPGLSFLHPTLSLADTIQQAFGIVKALGGGLNTGGPGQISRPDGSTANNSRHEDGVAADIGTGTSQPTAASLALFEDAKKLLGKVFKQIIHNGVGLNAGGGSFADANHFDHVHLEWLQGLGFSENSGKIGKPPVIDIPGAAPEIDAALNAASKKYGVELALVAAIAKQESHFNPKVTSPVGAGGLMQLMPATARSLGVSNVFDPFQNADGGTKYLKQLLHRFGGRYNLAMAGYNAGPNAPGLDEGNLPPYSETRNYVRLVTSYLDDFRRKFGGFREAGGPVTPGKAYVVGEKRPEIFVPNRPGTILPDAAASLSSAGSTYQDNRTIHNTINTQASDPEAVADVFDARTRSSMTGVIFR